MKKYEYVFFIPWPPVNFYINRSDFLLKIRGGPWSMDQVHEVVHGPGPSWGGPWTPVHVLYMPDFYNTLSVNLIGNTVKYAREYDYSAPLGSEFILKFSKI